MIATLFFALVVSMSVLLPGAWRETQRREAYLPQLEAMARHDPYDGRLLALLGGRLMEAGEYPAAAETLERAVTAGEKNPRVWLTLASAKAAAGDPRAFGYLSVGAREINSPETAAALARTRALGKNPPPLALAEAICPDGPEPLVSAYTRGSLLNAPEEWWGRQHPEESGFATRQDWVRRQPDDAQAQRLWGTALMQDRRWPEAATALQSAVALAPNSAAAHLDLAGLLEREGLSGQASLEYVACLRLRRDWLPALLGLGRMTLALQLSLSAVDDYTRATQIAPQSAEAWMGLGQADVEAQKNYDAALSAFQTAARLAPTRTDFFADYAVALRQSGRLEEAQTFLRRRLAASPADARSHYLLAALLLDTSATAAGLTEAQAQTQEVLRLAPQAAAAQQQMAELLLRQNKPQPAIAWLQKVLAGDPSNVKALLILSRAYQQAGLTAQASQASQQAAILSPALQRIDVLLTQALADPSNVGVHQQLAALYSKTGQTEKAQEEKTAVQVLRTNPTAKGQGAQTLAAMIAPLVAPH